MDPTGVLQLLDLANKLVSKNFTIIPTSTLQSLEREITTLWILVGVLFFLFLLTFLGNWDEKVLAWLERFFKRRKK